MERKTGIEPAWPEWKSGALPLSYIRKIEKNKMMFDAERTPVKQ